LFEKLWRSWFALAFQLNIDPPLLQEPIKSITSFWSARDTGQL